MKIPRITSIFTNITLFIIASMLITAYLLTWRSEVLLESMMLDQTKQKAAIYLLGIEKLIREEKALSDKKKLHTVLLEAMQSSREMLGFSMLKLYVFDKEGKIIAYTGNTPPSNKNVTNHYASVLRDGKTYLGEKIEYFNDPATGFKTQKVDIILPIWNREIVEAALEVEVDITNTIALIKQLDDDYERENFTLITAALVITMLLIGWVIRIQLILPLRDITATTTQIASGDLSSRINKRHSKEFGHLSNSVNHMAESIEQLLNEQEEAYISALQSLAKALAARDPNTAKHSSRVAKYSVMLGKRIGLDKHQLHLLKRGSMVHDIGKIGIPDAILNKPAALSETEYAIMKEHPVITASIMKPLKRFKEFTEIAAWHHERWDGDGYPDGLEGDDVPLLARIVGIADSWDAMTGDRVYREGMPTGKALNIMEREIDSGQWDPNLLREFIDLMRSEEQLRPGAPSGISDRVIAKSGRLK